MGIEDFIKSIKRARLRCYQPDLLLDVIFTEKIQEQAKRSIPYAEIGNYDDLYKTMR